MGENGFYFIASAYWALVALDIRPTLDDALTWSYKHICTCDTDINEVANRFGGDTRSTFVLSACSETTAKNKVVSKEMKKEK